ncbi:MAG: hypothetical protein ACREEC_03755, partial [Thermoplasmata archaeon]
MTTSAPPRRDAFDAILRHLLTTYWRGMSPRRHSPAARAWRALHLRACGPRYHKRNRQAGSSQGTRQRPRRCVLVG